ncbi:hypothetical protein VTK26DRAFT_5107 [Humicola hyalothermophila]
MARLSISVHTHSPDTVLHVREDHRAHQTHTPRPLFCDKPRSLLRQAKAGACCYSQFRQKKATKPQAKRRGEKDEAEIVNQHKQDLFPTFLFFGFG